MDVSLETYRNDIEEAQRMYRKNNGVEIIRIDFENAEFKATKRMSVAEAEDLIRDLSDWVRWVKEV